MKKLAVLLFVLLVTTGCIPKADSPEISEEEQAFNENGNAKAVIDETNLWNFYEDRDSGIKVKAPLNVVINKVSENGEFQLNIDVQSIDSLEDTMGFDAATALQNKEALANGEYGEEVDWPIKQSMQIKTLGDINAQEFMVLSRFEVCDITFERKLYFLHNNYQIVLTLFGPKKEIIASIPDYFKTDEMNCGEETIWVFDKQEEFYQELSNNNGNEIAQNWFNIFDVIVQNIEFTRPSMTVDLTYYNILQGVWTSVDDERSTIEFVDNTKVDYYENEKMSEGNFMIYSNAENREENAYGNLLVVEMDGEIFDYKIVELLDNSLELIYLDRGNTLKYER